MDPEKLLEAIGMLDDRHFETEETVRFPSWRRKLTILIAAIVLLTLTIGTAMAVSHDFRALIFSVFNIETHEQAPNGYADVVPPASGLQEIDIINIDGVVNAYYFSTEGIALIKGGGIYTCSRGVETVPEDAAFWEIRADEIVEVPTNRIDFPLIHGGRTFRIVFDYAVLNGELSIKEWPQDLDEDPYANGWYVEAIGDRTDIALLTVPVDIGLDFSMDLLLLDLATLEVTDLLESIPHDQVTVYGWRITEDLHYAILSGYDEETDLYGYWLCDLIRNTIITLDVPAKRLKVEPYFLDDSTLIMQESLDGESFHVVRWHLPTGVKTVVIENVKYRTKDGAGYRSIHDNGAEGIHGFLFHEDGSVDLIDLRTGAALKMTGLETDNLSTSESPDGTSVLISYKKQWENDVQGYDYMKLGVLDPKTGILKMLTREASGNPEDFWGWLGNDTVVLLADIAGDGSYKDGSYIYVYEFREQPAQ